MEQDDAQTVHHSQRSLERVKTSVASDRLSFVVRQSFLILLGLAKTAFHRNGRYEFRACCIIYSKEWVRCELVHCRSFPVADDSFR